MVQSVQMEIAGRVLSLETGKLAQQAGGAVMVRYGDTMVFATATASADPREGIDFFPLTVDYEEKLYAAGKIPGGYIKREGRPTQEAILNARLTDRPIRPLFPKGFRNDVQVICTVFSADQENDPDILSIIGASAALSISDIPFFGPVAAVKIGLVDGELIVNPTHAQLETSQLELIVAGTRDAIMMVEAGASEVSEERMLEALQLAHQEIARVVELQDELVNLCGKPKRDVPEVKIAEDVEQAVDRVLADRLSSAVYNADKVEREAALDALRSDLLVQLGEQFEPKQIQSIFENRLKAEVRAAILNEGRRPDGRKLDEIRPITCEVGLLPRTHGSGLFTRGQTQVLSVLTLGSLREEQMIDGLLPDETKRFMHHYNFPPYSTGEVKRLGSPGRREIGHGALAERAILAVIPDDKEFPYTIRIVSEVLSSNGSTSMGSVCGATLALMDAGVPISAPVAGVAMGLVMGDDGRYQILSDIQGMEDALGDMDFKVAGTANGITALQMDIKVKGITPEIMQRALAQAHSGRMHILGRMLETISGVRPELSRYAPRMTTIHINPEKIRTIIGPGGKMIRSIIEQSKATSIDIDDDGTVVIGATSGDAADRAIQIIEGLTKEVEMGGIYTGKVTRLTSFGAFVEILPGKEGLVRIGELADYRVPSVEDVVQVGDEIMVMVTEIDRMGRINLSRRAVLQGQSPAEAIARAAERSSERSDRGERGDRGGRGGRSDYDDRGIRPAGRRDESRGPRRESPAGPRQEPGRE